MVSMQDFNPSLLLFRTRSSPVLRLTNPHFFLHSYQWCTSRFILAFLFANSICKLKLWSESVFHYPLFIFLDNSWLNGFLFSVQMVAGERSNYIRFLVSGNLDKPYHLWANLSSQDGPSNICLTYFPTWLCRTFLSPWHCSVHSIGGRAK
jgi:hypothetical protein